MSQPIAATSKAVQPQDKPKPVLLEKPFTELTLEKKPFTELTLEKKPFTELTLEKKPYIQNGFHLHFPRLFKALCCVSVLLVILFVLIVTFIVKEDTVQRPISTNVAEAYVKGANKDAEVKLAKPTKSVERFDIEICGNMIKSIKPSS